VTGNTGSSPRPDDEDNASVDSPKYFIKVEMDFKQSSALESNKSQAPNNKEFTLLNNASH